MAGIYRRITVAMWADDKFRRLSRPKPNAQSLWVYLLAGPETSQIPGLIVAGEAGMAESLRWSIEAFRGCWCEIADQGMAQADWENRVVWVPNAVRHNVPANPNVIRSWREAWDLVPDCTLKADAWVGLRDFISGLGKEDSEPWTAAFDDSCRKPSSKPSIKTSEEPSLKALPKGSPKQEQEQEQELRPPSPKTKDRRKVKNPLPNGFVLDELLTQYAVGKGIPKGAVPRLFEAFREHHVARGSVFESWSAAWHTWVLNEIKWHPEKYKRADSLGEKAEDRPFVC